MQTSLQGSKLTLPEDVKNIFDKAKKKLCNLKEKKLKIEEIPVSLVIFDQLELAEKSVTNPLNVLYSKLESIYEEDNINFIGFSNYSLNPKIMNRALVLSVPDLDCRLDDLIEISRDISKSISINLKYDDILEILSKTYFSYKNILKTFKEFIVLNSYFEKYLKNQKKIFIDFRLKKSKEKTNS